MGIARTETGIPWRTRPLGVNHEIAFYLIAVYGAFGFLVTTWGAAAIEKYRAKRA